MSDDNLLVEDHTLLYRFDHVISSHLTSPSGCNTGRAKGFMHLVLEDILEGRVIGSVRYQPLVACLSMRVSPSTSRILGHRVLHSMRQTHRNTCFSGHEMWHAMDDDLLSRGLCLLAFYIISYGCQAHFVHFALVAQIGLASIYTSSRVVLRNALLELRQSIPQSSTSSTHPT